MELKLKDLSIGYKSSDILCSEINVSAKSGEAIALIGSNGAGKSTLLRSIASLIKVHRGEILIDNREISSIPLQERAMMLSMVMTQGVNMAYTTVRQVIELGRVPYSGWAGKLSEGDLKAVNEAMERTNVVELAGRTTDKLSDGQRQRVMLARALAQETPIMLLDEPTAFLDPENREMIINLLGSLAREMNKIIIYSTHEVDLAIKATSNCWVLKDKRLRVLGE